MGEYKDIMICYIVLHYQVIEETQLCVAQLRKLNGDHKIIIVDNCSPNKTGEKLKQLYEKDIDIDVILNKKNDGFARGNNLGCQFAKSNYNPDFYVVMNNDIEITQIDFENKIKTIYQHYAYDILGPDIFSTTYKVHQSPKSLNRTSIEKAKELKRSYQKKMESKVIVPIRCYLKKIPFLKKVRDKAKRGTSGVDHKKRYFDVPLHGSCVIFSKSFMNRREAAFFSGTFFYYEMEILDYEAQINGFKVVYDPSIKVLHHQNVSTNATYQNELKRVSFMNKENYNSIGAFLKEYDK